MPIVILSPDGRVGKTAKRSNIYLSYFMKITCIKFFFDCDCGFEKSDSAKQTQMIRVAKHHKRLEIEGKPSYSLTRIAAHDR